MASGKKIIAVLGSTGVQGGSVVRSLLADGTFAAAKKLKAAGAEVVSADLEDTESLKKAFKGAYGVFGVTGEGTRYSSSIDRSTDILTDRSITITY
ncbi:uncharacterized protein EI90DRAFT_3044963 [Cantharellus anzutake]|uniref:uncharacterized protein n=1 Tax=Cantharellus anzutake TaxID=1750568 RepID=UPI0019040D4D|nr:uncharacterized protein EI90DRAFT_3044963 [Cantharellus anzutake]KAF8336241.1 hypothetical protein EI90DRAFT_3044963 [Cantharellus anzutake]